MALNKNVTNRESQFSTNISVSADTMYNNMMKDIYKINQQKYAKYRKTTKKYFAATKTTNPYLNDPGNTVCHKENEDEHSKNSGKLYENNTHRVKKN